MKKVYIAVTSPLMFLTELPLIFTLILAIIYNDTVKSAAGLYPLIVALSLGIITIFLYLFRVIVISYDEVKIIGLFSSKDKAIINKGKTLTLTLRSRGRLRISLFGNDGQRPALDWASSEDYTPVDITLFREKAIGGVRTAVGLLTYFGVKKDAAVKLATFEDDRFINDEVEIKTAKREGERDIVILFKATL